MKILFLNRAEITELLSMRECIAIMEQALASLARGEVILPLRPVLRIPDTPNVFALMPAYSKAIDAIGTKLITVFPGNHGSGFDSHQGVVVLIDGKTGSMKAIMDAASITAIRTAAVSAVATMVLGRNNSRVLAILGSGVQALTHLEAMRNAVPIERVLLWSRNKEHAKTLAERAASENFGAHWPVEIEVSGTAEDAVRAADVICTVTASREPVLQGAWLKPGAHINAVGASIPTARELDTNAVRRSRLFVDRRESALNEAGDILIPVREGAIDPDHILAEVGEVLTGVAPGRRNQDDITLFKSLGLAVEDLASAHFLYRKATEQQIGTWVEL